MKPAFLFFFSLIFISSLGFAAIYTFWTDVVEANPGYFAIGLVSILTIGMLGMLFSINSYATERQRQYQ